MERIALSDYVLRVGSQREAAELLCISECSMSRRLSSGRHYFVDTVGVSPVGWFEWIPVGGHTPPVRHH